MGQGDGEEDMDQLSLKLLMRITSCLQAILDLEPQLSRLDLGAAVLQEFETLKGFLRKVDSVELSETDVARIEEATAHFLHELTLPLSLVDEDQSPNRLLQ